ncbi:WYL domain-containing protein [Romboutsia maritimum]|uniref:WYL domain-containing protein n=1 Tax=Romboutsia maritimum TaxID=2020948 RepID=A0A371IPV1_9FIRM|nr:WYL domain-containing protein [Romboutsia maritimum]RDY22511.1 WYL domain-containing protein [Romboutsia maritimum]
MCCTGNKANNNIKFYTFIDILSRYSDDYTSISTSEINNQMKKQLGLTLDRRTIYRYINDMQQLGLEVSDYDEQIGGYKMGSHKLEEYEIKLLIDVVLSSKFITKKKTEELMNRLLKLNSIYIGKDFNKKIYIDNRAKSVNEEIFINIDKINNAIRNKKKISFNYYDYNFSRELVPRLNPDGNNKIYIVNPISMIFKNENYYLVLADDKHKDLSNYRIDRMKSIEILDDNIRNLDDIQECKEGFNPSIYSKKTFKMFPGEEHEIEINFQAGLLNFIIDEFGEDVEIIKNENNTYNGIFIGKVGYGLTKWILQMGKSAEVLRPQKLRNCIKDELDSMRKLY